MKNLLSRPVGRRELMIKGGALSASASLVATAGSGLLWGAVPPADDQESVDEASSPTGTVKIATPGIRADASRSKKPVYLPVDPKPSLAACAVAEALFWTDIMMEHALFFTLLMPGERLKAERNQAAKFQQDFNALSRYLRGVHWRNETLPTLAKTTIPRVQSLIQFKETMRKRQEQGKLNSLVWPSFFAHTSSEAQRFIDRLTSFAQGDGALHLVETGKFWTKIMAEHLEFVSHLLDPQERTLAAKADEAAKRFYGVQASIATTSLVDLQNLANDVIDFKVAAEQGIDAGTIKSIIDPALADHVLREAIKFRHELLIAA